MSNLQTIIDKLIQRVLSLQIKKNVSAGGKNEVAGPYLIGFFG